MANEKSNKGNIVKVKSTEKVQARVVESKMRMLEALEASLGIVTTACKLAGINRKTHYEWLQKDERYKDAVKSLEEVTLDFAESQLHSQIKQGSVAATIFYLKTKGRGRGYIERQELMVSDSPSFVITKGKAEAQKVLKMIKEKTA